MDIIKIFTNNLNVTLQAIFNHFKSVDNYIVKSDDENIELLLENEVDKAKFQHEIDELMKDKSKSRNITINNRRITISI